MMICCKHRCATVSVVGDIPDTRDGAMDNDKLYTLEEVAEYLRVHPQSVRRWLRAGDLAGAAIGRGGSYRIKGADVQAFLDARMGRPTLRQRDGDELPRRRTGAVPSPADHQGEPG